jgi:alpha-glucosidase (family GH31 glycosyl hydrolase)
VDYLAAYHSYLNSLKPGDSLTFSRAGFEGAQTVPAHWAGDERSTYSAFRASLRAGLSAAISGIPFWGWDLGGFNGEIPDAELFLRSTAMAAFCPIMQYHAETKGEKNRDRTPWNIAERTGNPAVIEIYRFFARLRMNLLPYLWAEALHCVRTSEALMRPLFSEWPDAPELSRIEDQYLLGRSLLVAPVLDPGRTTRTVVFPKGTWIDLFTRERILGPVVREVPTPLESLPVYLRAGSMVALNLPENGAFPGDIGSQWEDYTSLVLLIPLDQDLSTRYETYDGASIEVDLRTENGKSVGEIRNTTGHTVILWLDQPGTEGRQRISVNPGVSSWQA